jgi:hypothetical protein
MKSAIENLFEDYQKKHDTSLSLQEFEALLKLFPSLLVCMSDGKLDPGEKEGLLKNAYALTYTFENLDEEEQVNLYKKFVSELFYLIDHLDLWKEAFLSVIRFELLKNPEDKEYIMESLYLFANIDDGISIEEQLMIDVLVNDLQLA